MKIIALRIANAGISLLYTLISFLFPRRRKVTFLSRQSNKASLDFVYIQDELRRRDPCLSQVCICNRIEPGLKSKVSYIVDTFRSIYHLATSRVCVLDSYWPAVSVIKKKKGLVVVQIWHALGKVKQSGLKTVGKPGGRDSRLANVMHMHEGYDYIIGGAPYWNKFYCESFGCDESAILNYGLPRMDYLIHEKDKVACRVFDAHPELLGKAIVLYAPTFRRGTGTNCKEEFPSFDQSKIALIVKAHPNQALDIPSSVECPDFSAMDLLCVADCLITDYSAIALEAAVCNVKTLYYLYDYNEYMRDNGLNLDIAKEMPECVYYDSASLAEALNGVIEGRYPKEALKRYQTRYLIRDRGHSTEDISSLILDNCSL